MRFDVWPGKLDLSATGPFSPVLFTLKKSLSLLFISRHSALRWESKDGCCGTHVSSCVVFGVDVCGVEGLYEGERKEEGSLTSGGACEIYTYVRMMDR